VFQPHRYTRTQELLDEFALAFNNADLLFVLDIYAASEQPIEGITAGFLTDNIRRFGHKNAYYIGDIQTATEKVVPYLEQGDLLITLGAGTVTRLSDEIVAALNGSK
jgi:UDP-N-acetylmuramate--alanine ligase